MMVIFDWVISKFYPLTCLYFGRQKKFIESLAEQKSQSKLSFYIVEALQRSKFLLFSEARLLFNIDAVLSVKRLRKVFKRGERVFLTSLVHGEKNVSEIITLLKRAGAKNILCVVNDIDNFAKLKCEGCKVKSLRDCWVDIDLDREIHQKVFDLTVDLKKWFGEGLFKDVDVIELVKLDLYQKGVYFCRVGHVLEEVQEDLHDAIVVFVPEKSDITIHLQELAKSIFAGRVTTGIAYRGFRRVVLAQETIHPDLICSRAYLQEWFGRALQPSDGEMPNLSRRFGNRELNKDLDRIVADGGGRW